jgi:hypothetical protein
MASTVIYRDSVSTGHNKFTFSAWVKRSAIATSKTILGMYNNNDQRGKVRFGYSTDNKLYVWLKNAVGTEFNWYSNREFRDCNGYYHIVVTIDTTQATASNRCKVYVNGEQLTGNTSGQDIVQNSTTMIFGHSKHSIGNSYYNGSWESQYFDGIMSHVHCCYGYAYQGSDFGETDSTTGEWKIKTSPNVQYGTNGFFILKDGNSTTDQSGNNISLTTNGTLTKTEDNPSNVFCTWNRLNKGSYIDMNYGNTNIYGNTSTNNGNTWGTISFPPSGKYYWETKVIAYNSGSTGYPQIGIIRDNTIAQGSMNGGNDGYVASSKDCYYAAGGTTIYSKNGNVTISAISLNDIIMCAMDSTAGNMKFWMGVNGTWWNSGDPANGTNAIWTETGDYQSVPFISGFNGSRGDTNFGNGYFGTTAVSSAGTNASGNGIFEYDVPTGYTALSTKGLNE